MGRPPSPTISSGADLSTVSGTSSQTFDTDADPQNVPGEGAKQQREGAGTNCTDRPTLRLAVPNLRLSDINEPPTLLKRLQDKPLQTCITGTPRSRLQSSPRLHSSPRS